MTRSPPSSITCFRAGVTTRSCRPISSRSCRLTWRLRAPGAAPRPRTAGIAPSFTEDQAERGHLAYAHNCLDCHGSNLDNGEFGGPPLKGSSFARHWDASSVGALFSFMKAKMPPDRPGQLNDETYTDIITYILSENGYKPTDKELPTDPNAQQAMSLKR